MRYQKKYLPLVSAAIVYSCAIISNSAYANNVDSWARVCRDQDGSKVCNTISDVVTDYGQPLTIVNLVETQKDKKMLITVPTGRHIPEGVSIQIGKGEVKKLDYSFCLGAICIAEGVLNDDIINSMKSGDKLRIISVNYQGSSNPIDVPLKGFSAAYKSKGITEAQFDEMRSKRAQAAGMLQAQEDEKLLKAQQAAKKGS
ncbi:invasion associated locus B family protein [Bartonella sp. TP]|uniref:invasion associated locus B family protein n=1 Tax=Bartonella sp. TP TaxID=3057550 RepID=UPI0025B242F1|nr:invasion associated locus B family protein [Bartonella sp. TP]MDN5248788.1 invasion associated locus B family protein [Alphaproteobacteria bacterium]WJW80052.1 invasion associated locus B family protein [Bartonella sp. TP]